MHLKGRKIIVGVTGSIAAYKAALLIRLLKKQGAHVQVIMTSEAQNFITPLTLATLSGNPVLNSYYNTENGVWHNHVELGIWADALLIAPATANTIGKFANGITDNLLSAVYLSARCPVLIAPAMDLDMLKHPSTRNNLNILKSFGNRIIDPGSGELASGLVGEGRLSEPEEIIRELEKLFSERPSVKGKKVLITSGPTVEPFDPVRFVSNHSTGKMGYELAKAFDDAGAKVTLVSGPVHLKSPADTIKLIKIQTAEEMYNACLAQVTEADLVIFAAAVADYRPAEVLSQKMKKSEDTLQWELTKNRDIAKTLGSEKKAGQIMIGFALETDNEIENARKKLLSKNLDMVILNSLNDEGAGFGHDTNKITVIEADGSATPFVLKSKEETAWDILSIVEKKWEN